MSDKLEWMRKHIVLFMHHEVAETCREEHYPQNTACAELAREHPDSEGYLLTLHERDDDKEACSFLAYNLHRRAAVWWAYLCVVDLLLELKAKPPVVRDIADIGKPSEPVVPDWAKVQPPPPRPEDVAEMQRLEALAAQAEVHARQAMEQARAAVDPELLKMVDAVYALINDEFRKQTGTTPEEALQQSAAKLKEVGPRAYVIDEENSPVFKAADKIRADIEKQRQDAIKLIKQALPAADESARQKLRADGLTRTYAYVISPDETNAKLCMDIGTQAPDQPAGLLAACAFWSFGDLAPGSKMIVPTPAGMLGNGINSLLLMLALSQGGERDFKQRFARYYELGYDVAIGANNWSLSVEHNEPPHRQLEDLPLEEEKEENQAAPSPVQRFTGNGAPDQKQENAAPQPSQTGRFKGK